MKKYLYKPLGVIVEMDTTTPPRPDLYDLVDEQPQQGLPVPQEVQNILNSVKPLMSVPPHILQQP